jgi:hypothetical protein
LERHLFVFELNLIGFCKICGVFVWFWLIVRCPFVNFIKLSFFFLFIYLLLNLTVVLMFWVVCDWLGSYLPFVFGLFEGFLL